MIIIHAPTQEIWNEVIAHFGERGNFILENLWNQYQENLCIDIEKNKLHFCSKKYYQEEYPNIPIQTFEEYKNMKKYPYKAEFNGIMNHFVVEFTAPKTGAVVEVIKGQHYEVGDILNNWREGQFTPIENKLSFPLYIHTRDKSERDAAAAWLVSKGCLVHGIDKHLNGEYATYFGSTYNVLAVNNKNYFCGSELCRHSSAIPFFENVGEISKPFEDEEIKVGDWVVAEDGFKDHFTEGKVYKCRGVGEWKIDVERDDTGDPNGWSKTKFRKAKPHEIPQLPKINGYEGELSGDVVKYGSAEISIELLESVVAVNKTDKGNRKIKSIILDSGVVVTVDQIKEILKVI